MNVILRGPSGDSAVPALSRKCPLVLVPFLGGTVLGHALAALAAEGVKRVRLEVDDRVEQVREFVGRGKAWGLDVAIPTQNEPAGEFTGARVVTLDRLPQLPAHPLWTAYRDFHTAQLALIPLLAGQRVGVRSPAPGVYVGLRSQIAADARLEGPCWIGANVLVGDGACIGPGTVIEDGCYVDSRAEVVSSLVGPQTYVGAFTELRDSYAWGNDLLQLDTGSLVAVSDRFLLGDAGPPPTVFGGWLEAIRRRLGKAPAAPSGNQ